MDLTLEFVRKKLKDRNIYTEVEQQNFEKYLLNNNIEGIAYLIGKIQGFPLGYRKAYDKSFAIAHNKGLLAGKDEKIKQKIVEIEKKNDEIEKKNNAISQLYSEVERYKNIAMQNSGDASYWKRKYESEKNGDSSWF